VMGLGEGAATGEEVVCVLAGGRSRSTMLHPPNPQGSRAGEHNPCSPSLALRGFS